MKDYACIFGTKDGVEYGRYVFAPTLSTAFDRAALQFPKGEYESNDVALCLCPADRPSSCPACLRLAASVSVEEDRG